MKTKDLSDEDLAHLGRMATEQLRIAKAAWRFGMRHLLLTSKEYRSICSSSKAINKSYDLLHNLARNRGWTDDQLEEVFIYNESCTWN